MVDLVITKAQRLKANQAAQYAIKHGTLKREPCVECGHPKGQAHHEDYSRPLDVVWLCYDCHLSRHGKARNVGPMVRCSIEVNAELGEQLERHIKATGETKKAIIERAIKAELARLQAKDGTRS